MPVGVAALRLSDSVRSLSSRRGGRPKRPPRILVRVPRTLLLLVDQGLDLGGLRGQRNLELAELDPRLRSVDLVPDFRRDETRLQERDTAVREGQVVAMRSVRSLVDVRERLFEGGREVPEHRGE